MEVEQKTEKKMGFDTTYFAKESFLHCLVRLLMTIADG